MISLLLHDIRSAHNVGSIFRTADAAGVSHIYFTGYTPRPYKGELPYTTKPERSIIKTALGAEQYVEWSEHDDVSELLSELSESGVEIVALEQAETSIDYRQFKPQSKDILLILGNEPVGISYEILERCDTILEIPMRGKKDSLNVSVAAGIALYELTRLHQ